MLDDYSEITTVQANASCPNQNVSIEKQVKAREIQRLGRLFVVSAPSGAGKTTLCSQLIQRNPNLSYSVSWTSRKPRAGEIDGVHYHYTTIEKFENMIDNDEFVEWAEVHGNYYGTARPTIEAAISSGHNILLDIDTQGAKQVKLSYPNSVLIFITVRTFDELRRRLSKRNTESEEIINLRMLNARKEIMEVVSYDYLVYNDTIEESCRRLQAIYDAEHCRVSNIRKLQHITT